MNFNKKADERYLSPWMFIIWGLIGVAIVAGVIIFYSSSLDVREEESKILLNRVADCLVGVGNVNENYFKEDFDFYQECNLNKEIFESGKLYYVGIIFYNSSGQEIKDFRKEYGVLSWKTLCDYQKGKTESNFPQCSQGILYAANSSQDFRIKIIAGSNQIGSKI